MKFEIKGLKVVAAAALLACGCVSVQDGRTLAEIRESKTPVPAVAQTAEPNAFADYGPGMSSDAKLPMAVEWQRRNDAAIKAETTPEKLKACVADAPSAGALLAQVKGAYDTDPMAATKIAAVSQLVMCAKWPEAPKARRIWTKALLASVATMPDAYRVNYFLDQLRWCGRKEDVPCVRAIGEKASDPAVRDFAFLVARELDR
jgi:hypothetical protein